MPRVGRAGSLVAALATWFVLVLVLAAGGFAIGAMIPCEGGLECLDYPFGGALLGALLGAVAAAVLAARWMRWWWLPTTIVLVVPAVMLAEVDETLSLVLVLMAPVVAGLTAVGPRAGESGARDAGADENGADDVGAGEPGAGERRRAWLPGAVALACAVALATGTWIVLDREERREEIAELEAVGADLVAPVGREDLSVWTVTGLSGDLVSYIVARGEIPDAAYLDVDIRPGGGDCLTLTDNRPCEDLGDGLSVYRQPESDHYVVYVDLGGSNVRLTDRTNFDGVPGWTEDETVELARELQPVDAAWLVDHERQ
ncbi:hypothetical protein SGUI_0370 [Serinicoccus hydrothermalis]|uniref:Uncharacterized protein n=1 Tax=Serinicoccus hydrothermalis TaxID=1758689 RepID=A0A1B1N8L7_9MICO|nr:hypothetical protein [Serinicoccus hydrothermalis]ANS77766.1 hypothetical protein SGUI_0370 [Serinicoccus hydrothermalis]